ncbi:GNAT family N-acetyltransferase [Ruminococcus flavefaciens]|uniref:Protein N-acetyltransferase, RimJ/RimL family n=1 Tax=Ruminococcus flavefaciens TaxID=1265 RepID=A0A1M7II99_RUMFL|nr:GNAT family protein [Ruminococcus flavefaciens]SHM40556.1 Protein N-acetyltransferase, RimJ/RimL family [Ruminococcus flavefaciens]
MRLREFIPADAEHIVSWISDEREFRCWCADRYESFPISANDIVEQYAEGVKGGSFFPFTATDENDSPVGHFILRYPDEDKSIMRLGFVILRKSVRGKGMGCELVSLAKKYASEVFKAQKLTLGVFENNTAALNCYSSAGFTQMGSSGQLPFLGEIWTCIEMETQL